MLISMQFILNGNAKLFEFKHIQNYDISKLTKLNHNFSQTITSERERD